MTWIDYLVVIVYLAGATAIGVCFRKGPQSGLSYFLGNRSIHWLPAGITMTAVSVSAITFIGMPGQSFKSDWTFLQIYLVLPFAAWIVARFFLPIYSDLKVATAYEYLERRFNLKTRLLSSAIFQIIICGSTGVVIYAPAIMFSEMAGLPVDVSILIIGTVTTTYTLIGGIRGVIYTDILQSAIFMSGWLLAVMFILNSLPGGIADVWSVTLAEKKLRLFDFSLNPELPATFWAGMIGMLFTHLALNGVNQAQVQKYLAVSSLSGGRRAILFHGFSLLAVYVAFFALGTLLFVFYALHPNRLPSGLPPDHVFPFFIMNELSAGLRGLLIIGAFSAAMSTLSSSLNSLANVTVVDFLDRLRPGRTVLRAKLCTALWGVTVVAAGLLAVRLGSILELIVKVNSYFYGCLLGVFMLGMLSKRASSRGAFLGLCGSMLTVLICSYFWPGYWVWFGAIGCLSCFLIGSLAG